MPNMHFIHIPAGWKQLFISLLALNIALGITASVNIWLYASGPSHDFLIALSIAQHSTSHSIIPNASYVFRNMAYQSPLIESSPLANLSTKNFVYAASHDTDIHTTPLQSFPIMEDHTIPKVEDLRLTVWQLSIINSTTYLDKIQFLHGVASGDPLDNSIILWSKISPPSHLLSNVFRVQYQLTPDVGDLGLLDQNGPHLIQGLVSTEASIDFVVKVDVGGLSPNTKYIYRFKVERDDSKENVVYSPIGFTRTLPDATFNLESLKIAIVSCSNFVDGFFNAYANIANKKDIDIVLHLGDYIYEYAEGGFGFGESIGRLPLPNRPLETLQDYRTRHAQYKLDPDLQAAHQFHPWIVIWDDHEFADNIDAQEKWRNHTQAGMKAYFEYLPIREARVDDNLKYIDHSNLATWLISQCLTLDSRAEQENWLYDQLLSSKRNGTIGVLSEISIHSSFAFDIVPDPFDELQYSRTNRTASLGVELVSPSVTSSSALEHLQLGMLRVPAQVMFKSYEPHLHHVNLCEHGYILVDVSPKRVKAEYWYSSDIKISTTSERLGAVIVTERGSNRITESQIF
ncbi:hypothetical protein BASA60_001832 [Batrachochytrium salamandrivorans]|nr:hypothetical protein BASA60_001832 [Batrachochytrium salamandrivorans]